MLNFKQINTIFILILVVFAVLKLVFNLSIWWIFLSLLIWLVITIIGSFHIRWNYFLKSKNSNYKVNEKVIALTFDDGPNKIYTPKVLALLKDHNAKASFFCIGQNVKDHPNILKEIIREGHLIGNHSFFHKNSFGFLSTEKVIKEIENTNKIIEETVNLKVQLFRPPFGVTNPNIANAVQKLRLQSMGWSIRSLDTISKNPEKVYKKIISKIKKGDIVLLHDTNELSLFVLKKLLLFLKENNIKTVTLDELFKIEAYES